MSLEITAVQKSILPTPETLVKILEETASKTLDPKKYLAFSETKRSLKELARKGELLPELRQRVLAILKKKGFKDSYEPGTPIRFCPSKILFTAPRLWNILHHPEKFPNETKVLKALDKNAYEALILLEYGRFSVEILIDVILALKELKIPELEPEYISTLNLALKTYNPPVMDVRLFYLLTAICPTHCPFAKLCEKLPTSFRNTFPMGISIEEMANEYALFEKMSDGAFASEVENLSSEALYRFYVFLCWSPPTPLLLVVFDALLLRLQSGHLDLKYAQELIEHGNRFANLHARLNQDSLVFDLGEEVGEMQLCLWPFFAVSAYVQRMMLSPMARPTKVRLEGYQPDGFSLFYQMCIRRKNVDLSTATVEQFLGTLDCIDFFQVKVEEVVKRDLIDKILEKVGRTAEGMAALAEVCTAGAFSDLEKQVIAWLSHHSWIRMSEGSRYYVELNCKNNLPNFATMAECIKVLKVLNANGHLLEVRVDVDPKSLLSLLCAAYSSSQLKFADQQAIEKVILSNIVKLQDHPSNWGTPLEHIALINALSDPAANHVISILGKAKLWDKVRAFIGDEDAASFKRSTAFEGQELNALSAKGLTCFLHSLTSTELEERRAEIELELTRRYKEKQLDFEVLRRATEDLCAIERLKVGVDYNGNTLQLPLVLLLKMRADAHFENLPTENVQWAIDFIDDSSQDKTLTFSAEEARALRPSHFQALRVLQTDVFDIPNVQMQTNAGHLRLVFGNVPEETFFAAVEWFSALRCGDLVIRCANFYCRTDTLILNIAKDYSSFCLNNVLTPPLLRILKAIGKDFTALQVNVGSISDDIKNPCQQIVEACPNLRELTLHVNQPILLDAFPFEQLPQLKTLRVSAKNAICWQFLAELKVPPTIERVIVEGQIDDIEKAGAYPFFASLPSKGVCIDVDLQEQGMYRVDSAKLFTHLSHCEELELGTKCVRDWDLNVRCLERLKKLKVFWKDMRPAIGQMTRLSIATYVFEISQASKFNTAYFVDLQLLSKTCNIQLNFKGAAGEFEKFANFFRFTPHIKDAPTLIFNVEFHS